MKQFLLLALLLSNYTVIFGQNVGIGTSQPPSLLSLNSKSEDGTGNYSGGISFTNNVDGFFLPWTQAAIWAIGSSGYNGILAFGTDGNSMRDSIGITEKMRITADGRVGIGETTFSDYDKFVIKDGSSRLSIRTNYSSVLGAQEGRVSIKVDNNRLDLDAVAVTSKAFIATELIRSSGSLETLNSGTISSATTIFAKGNISTDAAISALNNISSETVISAKKGFACRPGQNTDATGNVFNINWTGDQLEFWIDGTRVYVPSGVSDRRLKENIKPETESAINRVLQLKPSKYNFKNIPGSIFNGNKNVVEGFIADELQQVIPSAVTGKKDALTKDGGIQPQTVNPMPVVAVLTKAVQEQQTEIELLKKQVEELKAMIKK